MKKLLAFLISLMLLMACATEEEKQPPAEGKLADEAFVLIDLIKQKYEENHIRDIEDNCSSAAFKDINLNMRKFTSAHLEFTPKTINVSRTNTVRVSMTWRGAWKVGTRDEARQGLVVFVLEGTPLKLVAIEKASPFKQP